MVFGSCIYRWIGAKSARADELVGLGVYAVAPKLIEKFGDKVAIALIGPGGEMKLKGRDSEH